MSKLEVEGIPIKYEESEKWQQLYFSLPDLCKGFDGAPKDYISNWLRTRSALNFMAEWEKSIILILGLSISTTSCALLVIIHFLCQYLSGLTI